MLKELQVKKGKYTIAIKYKNHKAYTRVVNLAPQERILIEHSFRKSTATAKTKNNNGKQIHWKRGKSTSENKPCSICCDCRNEKHTRQQIHWQRRKSTSENKPCCIFRDFYPSINSVILYN